MSEIDLIDYLPEELHEYYNKIQNLFPVCLKCQKPVFIKNIIDNKVVKIKIDCEYCQNNQVLTTEEYINQLFSNLSNLDLKSHFMHKYVPLSFSKKQAFSSGWVKQVGLILN